MNKSTITLIVLGIIALSFGAYATLNNDSDYEEEVITRELSLGNTNPYFSTNICESENETTWWKDDEGFYSIGNKPIEKDNCSLGGYSIRFSKEYVLAMVEIMDDVLITDKDISIDIYCDNGYLKIYNCSDANVGVSEHE